MFSFKGLFKVVLCSFIFTQLGCKNIIVSGTQNAKLPSEGFEEPVFGESGSTDQEENKQSEPGAEEDKSSEGSKDSSSENTENEPGVEANESFSFSLNSSDSNYVCNQTDKVEVKNVDDFCGSNSNSNSAGLGFLLKGAKSGHYTVLLSFSNGQKIEENHFTHTSRLNLIIKSKYASLGSLNGVSATYLYEDQLISPQRYEKINVQSLLQSRNRVDVSTFSELAAALYSARGGEVIVVRENIHAYEKEFRSKEKYSSTVHVVGMKADGSVPHLDQAVWRDLENISVTNLKVNRKNVTLSKYGFSNDYAWRVNGVKNMRVTGVHVFGSDDGLSLLAQNSIKGVFNDPRGIFVRNSEDVLIDHNLFENLYHAMEFQNVIGLYAVSNKADKITSDMFSGGGLQTGLFESNLSLTKMPVHFTINGKYAYTHSDMIQLYTTNQPQANQNITIRNNIALAGDAPVNNKLSAGWQCFFTRDEKGDQNISESLPYKNVRIYNNLCVSNQHHGVTIGRGSDNYIASNMILELKGSSESVTAGIRVNSNVETKVFDNVSKTMVIQKSFDLDFVNNKKLNRKDEWIKEFYETHIGNKRVHSSSRNPASVEEGFEDVFNVNSLGLVPFN